MFKSFTEHASRILPLSLFSAPVPFFPFFSAFVIALFDFTGGVSPFLGGGQRLPPRSGSGGGQTVPPPLRFGSSTSLRVGNFKKEEFFPGFVKNELRRTLVF